VRTLFPPMDQTKPRRSQGVDLLVSHLCSGGPRRATGLRFPSRERAGLRLALSPHVNAPHTRATAHRMSLYGGGAMRRSRKVDEFEVRGIADRLVLYGGSERSTVEHDATVETELVEKAVTLLRYLPRNQPRARVEKLLSPNDPQRGGRAIDALIDAALATEDEGGHLRRTAVAPRPGE
jgi:hypothetical protein